MLSITIAVVVLTLCNLAAAAVPKPADIATCNAEAKEAVRKGRGAPSTPDPTVGDERRAGDMRRQDAPTDGTQARTPSSDPQIAGMDAQGAKNPIYQAAYRTCIRKNGY